MSFIKQQTPEDYFKQKFPDNAIKEFTALSSGNQLAAPSSPSQPFPFIEFAISIMMLVSIGVIGLVFLKFTRGNTVVQNVAV